MKNCYLYIRVSTDEQAERGYSQRAQEETLRRYCELNNIFIKGVYHEDHSAKTFNRPRFTQMLLTMRKHKNIVDIILFTKWDRFSRNAGDAYGMISTLNKMGVDPQAVEQPLDLTIPENKMMLAFYLAAPEVENDRRSLNVFHGMRRATKEGRWMGMAPIGYINKTSEHGQKSIEPHPRNAGLIMWVFAQIAEAKYSTESILKEARSKGLVCSKNNFHSAIRNPVYCGKIKVKAFKDERETVMHGVHAPIISEDLFNRAQQALNGRKRIAKTKLQVQDKFPLRGFLICPHCKKMLTASTSRGRSATYDYYHCNSECGCRFKAEIVNNAFITELTNWKPHKAIVELYKVILKEIYAAAIKSRKDELKKIQLQLNHLTDRAKKARELLLEDKLDAEDYRSIKKECEAQTSLLELSIVDISEDPVNIEIMMENAISLLYNIDKIYIEASTQKKREIVGSIFPYKLEFAGDRFRTAHVNEAVKIIFNMGVAFSQIKMGQVECFSDLSHEVNPLVHISNHFLRDLRLLAKIAA